MGGAEGEGGLRSTRVVSMVAGDFFREKIVEALRTAGCRDSIDHCFCETMNDMRGLKPSMILLDLEHPHALKTLQEFGTNVVAFGPYMSDELRAKVKSFGATAYCRTEFFEQLRNRLQPYAP